MHNTLRETRRDGKLGYAKWSCFGIVHHPETSMASPRLQKAWQCRGSAIRIARAARPK
jgi:hypothetical protein